MKHTWMNLCHVSNKSYLLNYKKVLANEFTETTTEKCNRVVGSGVAGGAIAHTNNS